MSDETREVKPGRRTGTVQAEGGEALQIPDGWELLPPGDAYLTRTVKAAGPSWTVIVRKGRKRFSQGVWAPAENIEAARKKVDAKRSTSTYKRQRATAAKRREREHQEYQARFREAVLQFLDFHPRHEELALELARRVSDHATPVGSGTVARTQRIPIEKRAESAVIAWLRHATTAYDSLRIPRIKGRRREVRRELASQSRMLLRRYRAGESAPEDCPLRRALATPE